MEKRSVGAASADGTSPADILCVRKYARRFNCPIRKAESSPDCLSPELRLME